MIRFITLILLFPFLCVCASAQDCSRWADNSKQSVVSLFIAKTRKDTGAVTRVSGTGFIVSREGHVLTAYHVIAADPDTDDVEILAAIGSIHALKSPMQFVVGDKTKDIAILAFQDSSRFYDNMPLGDPFRTRAGGQLCSLSFSEPLGVDYQSTSGTLSSKNVEDKKAKIKNLWSTQMPSNFGESGAPVIDLANGGVVAIKYGGRDPSTTQNVNYLVPLNLAKGMLDEYCNVKIPTANVNDATTTNEAVLQSVKVTFILPQGDNKDFDTAVAISITKGSLVLASSDRIAPGVEFHDPGSYGPFSLTLPQTTITKSVYTGSMVSISISPNGNDRWITALLIEAKFSDNQLLRNQFGPVVIDQDNKVISFVNP